SLYSLGVNPHSDYALRWQSPGDELITNVPARPYPANTQQDQFYEFSEVLVEKASHIRLQYLNLSYRVNPLYLGKKFRMAPTVSFNIDNAGMIWTANKQGLDPDFLSITRVPPARIYTLGLAIKL